MTQLQRYALAKDEYTAWMTADNDGPFVHHEEVVNLVSQYNESFKIIQELDEKIEKLENLVNMKKSDTYFHDIIKDPVLNLTIGNLGAMCYVLDELNAPISRGFHSFYKEDGKLMGKIGATRSEVHCNGTDYPYHKSPKASVKEYQSKLSSTEAELQAALKLLSKQTSGKSTDEYVITYNIPHNMVPTAKLNDYMARAMTNDINRIYQSFKNVGWTDQQMLDQGWLEKKPVDRYIPGRSMIYGTEYMNGYLKRTHED